MTRRCLMAAPLGASAAFGQDLPRSPLLARIRETIAPFPGRVFLFAKNLDNGRTCDVNGSERVRTASTIKLPIMAAMFAAVEAGTLAWSDTLPVTERNRVSGSGVLSEFTAGVKLPVRDVMRLMIVLSDNTGTNMILDRIGADAVNEFLDRLGLPQTRCNRKVRGDGNDLKEPEGWSKAGRLPENARFGLGVSTPLEMVSLLEKLERGEVVSPAASKEMIAVLKRQRYTDGIGRHMGETPIASKSGALDHLRSDVGVVYAPGARIAMAITCDGIPRVDYGVDNEGLLLISRLAEMLVDGLRG